MLLAWSEQTAAEYGDETLPESIDHTRGPAIREQSVDVPTIHCLDSTPVPNLGHSGGETRQHPQCSLTTKNSQNRARQTQTSLLPSTTIVFHKEWQSLPLYSITAPHKLVRFSEQLARDPARPSGIRNSGVVRRLAPSRVSER